ncbi:MAG: EamA family transporter [Alphaproteobacteria bacterium]|nr:EamA family transporter [Alphaproteobacteria bacterium]
MIPWQAVVAALAAAMMHAAWNAGLKAGKDRLLDAALLFGVAGIIGLAVALMRPAMHPQAWLWIGLTTVLHLPYVYLLARAYELGELSHVYTIARGLPPVLITVLAAATIQEIPNLTAAIGIATISFGILIVGLSPGAHLQGTLIAVAVAVCIALYSLSDGIGVRASGDAIAYNGWIFLTIGIATSVMALMLRREAMFEGYVREHWRRGVIGGALSFVAYGLVLWAMTFAPIAAVSAFRETAVVFAALYGILFFGEAAGSRRLIGALIVAVGAVMLKLA